MDFTGCHDSVREVLQSPAHGNPLHIITHLLSYIRFKLNIWKHNGVNSLEHALKQTESDISYLESMDDSVASQTNLSIQYARLAAIQRQISIKWAQRARLIWVCDGDKNMNFFHNGARIHSHHNFISNVMDPSGNNYSDHSSI